MTERFALYMQLIQGQETVTLGLFVLISGMMGLWSVMNASPIKLLRWISGVPFWTFILAVYLIAFTYIAFFWPQR